VDLTSEGRALVTQSLPSLPRLLGLEALGGSRFAGVGWPTRSSRTFGGLVVAQALVAAGRTAGADRAVHSLHASFLRPGRAADVIDYEVGRVRDGRSFSARTVDARQGGAVLMRMTASFHTGEDGPVHQTGAPEVPGPERLPATSDWFAADPSSMTLWVQDFLGSHPLEVRFVTEPPPLSTLRGPQPPHLAVWVRCREPLGDDPLLHAAALTYASDLYLLSSALLPHGMAFATGQVVGATLNHSVWFHQRLRADDWLLYEETSPWTGDGRAMTHGRVFDRDGALVASLAQEGLLRKGSGG
jgi:acyl-CoA thioesterase II